MVSLVISISLMLSIAGSWFQSLKAATGLQQQQRLFKHVSPAGAAVATELSDTLKKIYFVDDLELSPIASAYAKGSWCGQNVLIR